MKAAIYARYSTDKQSEASIPDQFRQCERLAERNGFTVAARYQDAAVSGGTAQRPGYQQLLAAARRREFQVIVAEDSSRLWRNLAEQAPRLAELRDLGIHVVTADLDTRQESAAILGAVMGAMGEQYRAEIGRRTRRGLEGRARANKPTGGKAYGYRTIDGVRVIDPEQAAVVVRIFTMYAEGFSPRAIADKLNAEGIPSPGAKWNRSERRRAGWLSSAIAGDPSRGLGILNNELYAGRVIWNRFHWIRGAADSKQRRMVPNPPSEWVVYEDEALRIVPEALWQSVKARQTDRRHRVGERVKAGLSVANAGRTGRQGGYLLSGILKCADCGSNFVIADRWHYACASRTNGGHSCCGNDARFRRDAAQDAILAGVRRELAAPTVVDEVLRRVRARLREQARPRPSKARMVELETQIANLIDAIAAGGLRGSTGLADRLRAAESELAALKASATDKPAVERLLPDLAARYAKQLERLPQVLEGDVTRARAALAAHIGPLSVEATDTEIRFYAEQGHVEAALLQAAGATANKFGSGGRI